MKKSELEPNVMYAVYSESRYYGTELDGTKIYFTPDQLERGPIRGKITAMVWGRPWGYQKNQTPTWRRGEISLNKIQSSWPAFLERVAETKRIRKIAEVENAKARAINEARQVELDAYLKENAESLRALGLPLPRYIGYYETKGGKISLSLGLEDIAKLSRALEAVA